MKDTKFLKLVVFVNSVVPLALLLWDLVNGTLGANPIGFALKTTGLLTLIFLFITLGVTPARKLLKLNDLIKVRRMLGLFAFFYGFLHLATYFVFDREANVGGTVADIWQRPFIAVGMTAFFLMIPLAVTSTNWWIKRIGGKRWQLLHRLIYVSAIGGVLHHYMIEKAEIGGPLILASILAFLLGYRIYANNQKAVAAKTSIITK